MVLWIRNRRLRGPNFDQRDVRISGEVIGVLANVTEVIEPGTGGNAVVAICLDIQTLLSKGMLTSFGKGSQCGTKRGRARIQLHRRANLIKAGYGCQSDEHDVDGVGNG